MRRLMRALMMSVLLILLAFVALNYWNGTAWEGVPSAAQPRGVGTTGVLERTRETLSDARLSSKIKAKMALDDTVQARHIGVSARDSVVTLSGVVSTVDEHDRAIRLARETVGVTEVVDRLAVQAPRSE